MRIAVIGAGFTGVGTVATLARAGHEVLVLDRGRAIGGRWRDLGYPGSASDVPGDLCSFSFAPNPGWSRCYPRQPEVLAYLLDVVARAGVTGRVRCGVDVRAAAWNDRTLRWRLDTAAGPLSCEILVAAPGPPVQPRVPDLPGLDSFRGHVLHTARWAPAADLEPDLAGRRVAVVGTGVSAIQLVPNLAGHAESVVVFQRTAPWILPRHDSEIPQERRGYPRRPLRRRTLRYMCAARLRLRTTGIPLRSVLPAVQEARCRRHLRDQVSDPGLRELLTPDRPAGSGRVLRSDDYYPALLRDDVELVASAAARVEPDAVGAADGSRREVDVIVLATGLAPTQLPLARHLSGRDGRLLADVRPRIGMQAVPETVPGFPNLFLLAGPGADLEHPCPVRAIEARLARLTRALHTGGRRSSEAIVRGTGATAESRSRS